MPLQLTHRPVTGPKRRDTLPPDIEVHAQIEKQVEYLLRIRAMFPFIMESKIGLTEFSTAPFYQHAGINIRFHFPDGITPEQVHTINSIGHWINQNFVIRLCAILEHNGVIQPHGQGILDESLPGFEDVNIVRRVRNVLAHTSGRYNSSVLDERRLYQRIVSHYDPESSTVDTAQEFPLSIDTVLVPMARGCQQYAGACQSDGAG